MTGANDYWLHPKTVTNQSHPWLSVTLEKQRIYLCNQISAHYDFRTQCLSYDVQKGRKNYMKMNDHAEWLSFLHNKRQAEKIVLGDDSFCPVFLGKETANRLQFNGMIVLCNFSSISS